MTIQEFISSAIEGGFSFSHWIKKGDITNIDFDSVWDDGKFYIHFLSKESNMMGFNIYKILLDPKVWEAVGKMKGWNSKEKQVVDVESFPFEEWEGKMIMIVHKLLKGSTLEEYIATL